MLQPCWIMLLFLYVSLWKLLFCLFENFLWYVFGNRILTGCYDNTLHVWDMTGNHKVTIPGHGGPIKAVSWLDSSDHTHTFVRLFFFSPLCALWLLVFSVEQTFKKATYFLQCITWPDSHAMEVGFKIKRDRVHQRWSRTFTQCWIYCTQSIQADVCIRLMGHLHQNLVCWSVWEYLSASCLVIIWYIQVHNLVSPLGTTLQACFWWHDWFSSYLRRKPNNLNLYDKGV